MWPGLFRALDGNIETGMARNGKWVYRGKLKKSFMVASLTPTCPYVLLELISIGHSRTLQHDSWTRAQGSAS